MTDPTLERLTRALDGRYEKLSLVGRGGMASVYRARDVKHHRDVALKVLHPEIAAAVGTQRFLHEIRVTAGLQHPHILTLYDSGEADGLVYYVMPFLSGETLADRLERDGPLPVDEAIDIAVDVARGLDHAHRSGVIHRDVKPGNIMLSGGRTFVCDFGIAHIVVDDAGGAALTSTGITVGTPLYMSPEQASGADDVTARSDVYGLACVLYQMLAGEPPYTGPTARMVTIKRMTDPIPSVRRLREAVPPEVDAVLTRALQKLPVDRFDSAEAFADALVEARGAAAGAPGVAAEGAAPTSGSPRASYGRGLAILGVAAVALAVLFVLNRPAVPGLPPASFERVTRDAAPELFPALTASGDTVVFERRGDLYLRSLVDGTEERLTHDPSLGNTQPTLSPDGHSVVFRSERNGGGLFVMELDGGAPARLTNFGYNPVWSPDGGRILFATEGVTDPSTRRSLSNLFVFDLATGEQRRVSDIDAVQPSWSPDGTRIAFWSVMRDGRLTSQRDIWTIAADGSDPVMMTDDRWVDWNPVWSADGRHLLFSSDRGGSRSLWSVPVASEGRRVLGPAVPLTSGAAGSHEHATIARHTGDALYVERLTTSNIHRIPFDPETGSVTGPPEPVTSGGMMAIEPSVSPDGLWVAFYTLEEPMALHVAATDGTGSRRITDDAGNDRSPQWAPDGRRLAFHSDRSDGYQIWEADVTGLVSGALAPRVGVSEAFEEVPLRRLTSSSVITIYSFWEPTSRRVGFVEIGRGVSAVSVEDEGAGPEMLIPGDRMVRPTWSPDGARIAGVLPPAAGGSGIVVYTLASRGLETISEFGDAPQWLPDGRRLVFAWGSRLYLADTRTGDVREIFGLGNDVLGLGSVSADGRWIYFSRTVTEADLWRVRWESDSPR
ncbi:MAG: protein kinase [Gemmatimonadota bacterium]|nr:protein kinase [Gemmatimonadota bacterium]